MSDWDEIDWEDESGSIAFIEWEKRNVTRQKVENDLEKIIDFMPHDWITILLYANGNSMLKTPIFKHLYVISERLGLNDFDIFSWYPYNYGAHSKVIENSLNELEKQNNINVEIGKTSNDQIYRKYTNNDELMAKQLWDLLPETIKDIFIEVKEELDSKNIKELVDFVHDAYPEYAIRARC